MEDVWMYFRGQISKKRSKKNSPANVNDGFRAFTLKTKHVNCITRERLLKV